MGLVPHSFLFWDFAYWPHKREWLLNKWPVLPNWKILTSISFSLSSSSDGKGPYMSSVDLQKNTILTEGRLKMIYEKKNLQQCLNTSGILSDTGKVWLTSVQQPTVICSPFSIQCETWSWSSWDYQWLPTPKVQIRGGRNEFTLDTNIFQEYVHTSITTYCHWHVLYQVWAMWS